MIKAFKITMGICLAIISAYAIYYASIMALVAWLVTT